MVPKKSPSLPSCTCQSSFYPQFQFYPALDTQTLSELCCRFTLAQDCHLLSWLTHWFCWKVSSTASRPISYCSWTNGPQIRFITSTWLGLLMGPCYPHLVLPIQHRCCRTVPWLVRARPVLGSFIPLMEQPHFCCSLTPATIVTWQGPSLQSSPVPEKKPVTSLSWTNGLLTPAICGSSRSNSSEMHEESAI